MRIAGSNVGPYFQGAGIVRVFAEAAESDDIAGDSRRKIEWTEKPGLHRVYEFVTIRLQMPDPKIFRAQDHITDTHSCVPEGSEDRGDPSPDNDDDLVIGIPFALSAKPEQQSNDGVWQRPNMSRQAP